MTASILIVDDDADLRAAVAAVLRPQYSVEEAGDGELAIERLAEIRPRLLILDVTMPGLGGLEVLGRARAFDPNLIVLMLTSRQEIDLAARALSLGASEFITKPFDADVLRREVAQWLDAGMRSPESPPWRHAP